MFSEGYIVNAFSVSFPVILVKNIYKFGWQESVRLEVKLATNTTETLNCLEYAEFSALIEIDQSRYIKYTWVWMLEN